MQVGWCHCDMKDLFIASEDARGQDDKAAARCNASLSDQREEEEEKTRECGIDCDGVWLHKAIKRTANR